MIGNKFLTLKSKNSIKSKSNAFLISAAWFNKWKKSVGIDVSKPDDSIKLDSIDNRNLLLKDKLKPTLTEKYDFVLLSPPLWNILNEWYPGGPEIKVKIIDHPEKHTPVPILIELTFSVFYQNESVEIKAHKYEQVLDIKKRACEKFNVNPNNSRICDFWNHNILPPISDNSYIYNLHLVDTQELLLQVRNENGQFITRSRSRGRLASRTNSSMSIGIRPFGVFNATTKGLVGLSNLGNTCFFNSAVQSLSHTHLFASFFMNANWRENINHINHLSTDGQLSNSFAQLVNDIWTKDVKTLSLKRLLDTVVQFAPRFGDHMQHDAQELMMFLLDGLHEDLNRANKKEYIEGIEGDDASCQETAAEASWKRHKL
ncbi:hypothetical protein TRFO_24411 [Tritrichomonas foetus]|uniref:Uncharacterized protein n=1 Tax=Tritrichomonas foetus TaxID=1144522 RepID=A0A1J4K860_9EUKA|nr:hypothetical protein TRFO_24411 [Tritrichomonas foetus]|eukprot:OHT07395.1 hypothetical protein TRFO_24411 [Tritrichomonas foetus]